MSFSRVAPTRVRTAIGLSVVLHLCALLLVNPRFGGTALSSPATVDAAPTLRITRIVRRTPAPPHIGARVAPRPGLAATVAVLRPRVRSASPAPLRRQRSAPAAKPSTVAAVAPPTHPRAAPAALLLPNSVPLQVAVAAPPSPDTTPSPAPTPTAAPTPTPTPTPSPAASATAAVVAAGNFSGLFSQNYPPVLPAPSIVESIRARLGGHGVIRVEVDEAGHATAIQFSGPPADGPAIREVRAELLGLTYVPADCNGLHCAGSLQIAY